MASLLLTAKRNVMRRRMLGDLPGHEFHGNQYTSGWASGAGVTDADVADASIAWASKQYPRADLTEKKAVGTAPREEYYKGEVDGLRVMTDIPNTDSIGATFYNEDEYNELPGIREVAIKDLDLGEFSSADDNRRVEALADAIKESGEIKPLIVVIDGTRKPYILEGGHRAPALKRLGKKTLPAVVIVDHTAQKMRGASRHKESAIHTAADRHVQPLTLAVMYAFLMAKRAYKGFRAAGDVVGHEFHGNQWTSGLASYTVDAKVPSGQREKVKNALKFIEKEHPEHLSKVHVFVAPTGRGSSQNPYGYTNRNVKIENGKPVRDANGDLVHTGKYTVYISSKQRSTEDFVRTIAHELEHVAQWERGEVPHEGGAYVVGGKTSLKFRGLSSSHDAIDAALKALRLALSKSLPPALRKALVAGGEVAVRGLRTLGDVEGHPFYGNQWTEGGAQDRLLALPKGNPLATDPDDLYAHWSEFDTGTHIPVNAPVKDVPIHLIDTDEHQITASKIAWNIKHPYAPGRAVSGGGRYYLLDGNHRVIAAYLKGEKTVKLRVTPAKKLEALALRTLKPPLRKKIGPLNLTFDAKNARAAKWALEHAAWLIDSITKTTREKIQEAVARAQIDGDLDAQYDSILEVIGDEARATMIARTESMTAANEGQRQGWEQAVEEGLLPADVKRQWIATDVGACPICEELDGTEVAMDEEFGDGFMSPPAHPSCRCTEGLAF